MNESNSNKTTTPAASSIATVPLEGAAVKDLLAAGAAIGATRINNGHALISYAVVPDGYHVMPIAHAELPPLPDHIVSRVELSDVESFIAYVQRYKQPETVILATLPRDGSSPAFTALFDYHAAKADGEAQARRVAHKATYPCPYSEEWLAWARLNAKAQKQLEFVSFIEARTPEISLPSAAELMEMALNFEARTEVEFASKVERVTGGRQLVYKEQVSATSSGAGGKITVPEYLALFLPVFEGGKRFPLKARLEYISREGKLAIVYHLQQVSEVLREALTSLRDDVAAGTGIVPMTGRLD